MHFNATLCCNSITSLMVNFNNQLFVPLPIWRRAQIWITKVSCEERQRWEEKLEKYKCIYVHKYACLSVCMYKGYINTYVYMYFNIALALTRVFPNQGLCWKSIKIPSRHPTNTARSRVYIFELNVKRHAVHIYIHVFVHLYICV